MAAETPGREWAGRGAAEEEVKGRQEPFQIPGGTQSSPVAEFSKMLLRINVLLFCPAGNLGKYCHLSIIEFLCLILFLSDASRTSSDSGTWRHPCGPTAVALGAEVGDWPLGGQGHMLVVLSSPSHLHSLPYLGLEEGIGAVVCVTAQGKSYKPDDKPAGLDLFSY